MPATTADASAQRKKIFGIKRLFRISKKGKKGDDESASVQQRSVQFANNNNNNTKNLVSERGWVQSGGLTSQQQQQQQQQTPTAENKTSNVMRQAIFQTDQQKVESQGSISSKPPTTTKKTSWLARTKFFKTMVHQAFEDIDADGSGDIDEKELYSGLLLIHLKLGAYAGPAACKVCIGVYVMLCYDVCVCISWINGML
jgi:hypothetical protein